MIICRDKLIGHKSFNHRKKIHHFSTKWLIVHNLHLNFLTNSQYLNNNNHKLKCSHIVHLRLEGQTIANRKQFTDQKRQEEEGCHKVTSQ